MGDYFTRMFYNEDVFVHLKLKLKNIYNFMVCYKSP